MFGAATKWFGTKQRMERVQAGGIGMRFSNDQTSGSPSQHGEAPQRNMKIELELLAVLTTLIMPFVIGILALVIFHSLVVSLILFALTIVAGLVWRNRIVHSGSTKKNRRQPLTVQPGHDQTIGMEATVKQNDETIVPTEAQDAQTDPLQESTEPVEPAEEPLTEDELTIVMRHLRYRWRYRLQKVTSFGFSNYLPTRSKVSDKVRDELDEFRSSEMIREEFWTELLTTLAKIAAYFKIRGFVLRVYAANFKGTAGKTLLLLYVGSLVKVLTGVTTGLISATRDRKSSTPGLHAGFDPDADDAMRHSEFTELNRNADSFRRPDVFQSAIGMNGHGVLVLKEDRSNDRDEETDTDDNLVVADAPSEEDLQEESEAQASEANPYPPADFDRDLETYLWQTRCTLIDGNNNDNDRGSIPEIAASRATVIMPVANDDSAFSLNGMQATVHRFLVRRKPIYVDPTQPRYDGRHLPTSWKVRKGAVFAFTNVKDDETDTEQYTQGLGSAIVKVRFDSYMHNEGEGKSRSRGRRSVKPVNLFKIQLPTLLDIAKLTLALCEESARALVLDDSHIKDIVVKQGYHPQMQLVDAFGRINAIDTTPTTPYAFSSFLEPVPVTDVKDKVQADVVPVQAPVMASTPVVDSPTQQILSVPAAAQATTYEPPAPTVDASLADRVRNVGMSTRVATPADPTTAFDPPSGSQVQPGRHAGPAFQASNYESTNGRSH